MKKIFAFVAALVAMSAVSCTNEPRVTGGEGVLKTFTVTAGDARTTLSEPQTILWSASDEINVVAATTGNQYTFTLKSGAGSASAVFEGTLLEADAEETDFYAVYPNVALRPAEWANGKIALNAAIGDTQTAVLNGYDPAFGLMTAVSEDGVLAFRHGMAYFKIKIGVDGVYAARVETSNSRFGGRPVYVAETGITSSIEGATGRTKVTIKPSSGTLQKDGVYYIPVTCKHNASLKNLTVTYFFDENLTISSSLTTSQKSEAVLDEGQVYDLGCPPISNDPILEAENLSIASDATGGSIIYTLVNPVEAGSLTAALDPAYDNTIASLVLGTPADGSIAFTCAANSDTENAKYAKVILTYTYNDTETVTAEALITQAKAGAPEGHVYTFYTENKAFVQTEDGEVGATYFTVKETSGYATFKDGDTGNYNVASFNIGGENYASGLKLDSNGGLQFTTTSLMDTKIRFWFARRKTGDTSAKIKLVEGDWGSSTVIATLDTPFGSPAGDSGEITLEQGKTYSIVRGDKEQALIYVTVTEF